MQIGEVPQRRARLQRVQRIVVRERMEHLDPLGGLDPRIRRELLDHPDLVGQIALAQDMVGAGAYSAEAHGTAAAGIIAARADNGLGIAGIAPGASVIALRACWESSGHAAQATCNSFTLAKALQFALEQHADVINMSLGGPRDRLIERLLDATMTQGVAVVAAVDPSARDGAFPASHPGVLAITDQPVQDETSRFLAAPGRDVPTTLPASRWGLVSGSSFAAAHVTGLIALLRELSPRLTPQQVREVLAPRPALSLGTSYPKTVDACAAVARTAGACACGCTIERQANAHLP